MNPAIAAFSGRLESYSLRDKERITEAAVMAGEKHGENLHHHLGTASILLDLKLDADAVIAVLLRDCISEETITHRFGKETLSLAEDTARIAGLQATGKSVQEAENIRKMLFAMVRDIRVILIKLADKLHTMRTLDFFPETERKNIAQECLDIYAPLADRLGISWIKDELEDLCLKHLNRDNYLQIKEIVALKRGERNDFLKSAGSAIIREAEASGISVEVQSRAKHFYSIYQKMRKRNKAPGDLYDLFGLRLLCETIDHCYTLLGLVHRLWKPLDGRFKDYIAMPKSNGYRSLHTTVFVPAEKSPTGETEGGDSGAMLEIQIRTREMHQTAEFGVAGHWIYKQGNHPPRGADISIVNRLKSWDAEESPAGEEEAGDFLEDIKRELLKDSIYVFTPQGKVIELPSGATPLDFAYHIHSAVGDHCTGAKANGAIIPLGAKLRNTQVVEILTATNARPTINWLTMVKTAKARSKIRTWLLQAGDPFVTGMVNKKKEETARAPAKAIPPKIQEKELQDRVHQNLEVPIFKIKVGDEKNMMIRFARCCNPILGDPIVGYVSRGRGIIIHNQNCGNLAAIPDFAERRIETRWEDSSVPVKRFKIEARRREALFSEIEGAVRKFSGHLIEGKLDETGPNHLTGYFTMQLEKQEDVAKVLKHIRGIPAVFSIQNLG